MNDIWIVGNVTWAAWFMYLFLVAVPDAGISLNWGLFWSLPVIGAFLWLVAIGVEKW